VRHAVASPPRLTVGHECPQGRPPESSYLFSGARPETREAWYPSGILIGWAQAGDDGRHRRVRLGSEGNHS
jgi:hypothetical protein